MGRADGEAVLTRDALERLFRVHYVDLVRLATYLTSDRDVAEELVQDAFIRAWRSRRRMRESASAYAYVRVIVVNLCRATLRRRLLERRHRSRAAGDWQDRDVAQSIDLQSALATLPPRKRACVVLRYFADLSEAETADLLGISIGTVKSQTSKALALLASQLGEAPVLRNAAKGDQT